MNFQNFIVRNALKQLHKKAKKTFSDVNCIRICQNETEGNFISYYRDKELIVKQEQDFGNFKENFKLILLDKGVNIEKILGIDLFMFYFDDNIQTDCNIDFIQDEKTQKTKISFKW